MTTLQRDETGAVTVDGKPFFKVPDNMSMLAVLGNNRVVEGSVFGDDFLIRLGDKVLGRWFSSRAGWKRIWPPGLSLKRVEATMHRALIRARRYVSVECEVARDVLAHHAHAFEGDVTVCGLNRWGNEMHYSIVGVEADYVHWIMHGSYIKSVPRTPEGDRFVRTVDRSNAAWGIRGSLERLFASILMDTLKEKYELSAGRTFLVKGAAERQYWFRLIKTRFDGWELESLDNFGIKPPETMTVEG